MLINVVRMIRVENYCLTNITVVTDSGENHPQMPKLPGKRPLGGRTVWSASIIPQIAYETQRKTDAFTIERAGRHCPNQVIKMNQVNKTDVYA